MSDSFERRRHPAQLRDQRRARALIERAAVLAGVLFETGDGAGDERIVVGHSGFSLSVRMTATDFRSIQFSNGLCIRIVSSRSGLVDSKATGHPTNSSIAAHIFDRLRRQSAHERARAVSACQPSTVS